MVIEHKKDGLIEEDKLDVKEKEVFIAFLRHERARHEDDIFKIDKTINKLGYKAGKKVKVVYIAGALRSDIIGYIKNLHRMIEYGNRVRLLGHVILIPGLDFLLGLQIGNLEYNDYFENSRELMMRCDAVFVVPGSENSKGVQKEIALAGMLGIQVYTKLEELKIDKIGV